MFIRPHACSGEDLLEITLKMPNSFCAGCTVLLETGSSQAHEQTLLPDSYLPLQSSLLLTDSGRPHRGHLLAHTCQAQLHLLARSAAAAVLSDSYPWGTAVALLPTREDLVV